MCVIYTVKEWKDDRFVQKRIKICYSKAGFLYYLWQDRAVFFLIVFSVHFFGCRKETAALLSNFLVWWNVTLWNVPELPHWSMIVEIKAVPVQRSFSLTYSHKQIHTGLFPLSGIWSVSFHIGTLIDPTLLITDLWLPKNILPLHFSRPVGTPS